MSKSGASSRSRPSSSLSSSRPLRPQNEDLEDINDLSDFALSKVSTFQVDSSTLPARNAAAPAATQDAAAPAKARGGDLGSTLPSDNFGSTLSSDALPLPSMGVVRARPATRDNVQDMPFTPEVKRPAPSRENDNDDLAIPEINHSRAPSVKSSKNTKSRNSNSSAPFISRTEREPILGSKATAAAAAAAAAASTATAAVPVQTPRYISPGAPLPQVTSPAPAPAPAPVAAIPPLSSVGSNIAPASPAPTPNNQLESVFAARPIAFGNQGQSRAGTYISPRAPLGQESFFEQVQQGNAPASEVNNSLESRVAQAHNRIFGDSSINKHPLEPKRERKRRELQADEIARRSQEIWGSSFGTSARDEVAAEILERPVVSTVVTSTPNPDLGALGKGPMDRASSPAQARMSAMAAAAAPAAAAAAVDDMPLRNPQGPSTLINGLAFDFNQSAENVNRRLEDVMRQNAPHPQAPSDGMSYTQRAFAALNRLNENSTRISGVSTALAQRHIDQEPTTNTLITSSAPNPAPAPSAAARNATAALPNLSDYHTATILSDNRGRLVSDELGHFTHESDLIKAAHTPTATAFKNAATSSASTITSGNVNTLIAKTNNQSSSTLISTGAGSGAGAAGAAGAGALSGLSAFSRPSSMGNTAISGPATRLQSGSSLTVDITSLSDSPEEYKKLDSEVSNSAEFAENTASERESTPRTESSSMAADNTALHSKLFTAGLNGASVITSHNDPTLQPPSAPASSTVQSSFATAAAEADLSRRQALNSLREAAQSLEQDLSRITQTLPDESRPRPDTSAAASSSASAEESYQREQWQKDPFQALLHESERLESKINQSRAQQEKTSTSSARENTIPGAESEKKPKNIFTMVPDEQPSKIVDVDILTEPQAPVHHHDQSLDEIVLPPPPASNSSDLSFTRGNSNNEAEAKPQAVHNPLMLDILNRDNPLEHSQYHDPGFTLSTESEEESSSSPSDRDSDSDSELPPLVVPAQASSRSKSSREVIAELTQPSSAPVVPAVALTTENVKLSPAAPDPSVAAMPPASQGPVASPDAPAAASVIAPAPAAAAPDAPAPAAAAAEDEEDEEWIDEGEDDEAESIELTPAQVMMHDYMERCHENVRSSTYFTGRAIGNDVIARFNLGYDPFYRTLPQNHMHQELSAYQLQQLNNLEIWQAAIIPLSIDSFVAYKIATVNATGGAMPVSWENEERRYIGSMQCFNLEAINQATLRHTPVFITGSEIDALTLESLNLPALALGHASNCPSLWRYLQNFMLQLRQNSTAQLSISSEHLGLSCYIALPDGALWDEARVMLKRGMSEMNITCHIVDLHSPYSSINLCLLQNRTLLLNKLYHLNEISDVRLQEAIVPKTPLSSQSLVLNLENLAKLQLSALLYTLASPAAALSRLVQACLVENPRNSIIYAGSRMQWQMLCSLLSFSPSPEQELEKTTSAGIGAGTSSISAASASNYRTKFLELPLTGSAEEVEKTLQHGLTMARLNGMDKFTLMVDTFALEQSMCAQLSSRLAHLCVEFNIGIMVWCSLEQKHLFEGNSLQTIEMCQGQNSEIIFKTLDSNCHVHTFSTVQG